MEVMKEFAEVFQLITSARERAFQAINRELIRLYWEVGRYIDEKVSSEQWGQGVVDALSEYIVQKEPEIKGFSARNIWRMRQFYETYCGFPALAVLVTELSWTNNLVILARTATELEREFYLKLSIEKKYSKRELERAISTSTFERTVLTEVKPAPVMPANHIELSAHFKDTYVFDFLKLPEDYTEKSLRKSIIKNLREFILELGGDFTFVAEEYRIQVGNSDFFIDLLFYHRGLRCLVPLELKVDKFRPEFISKMSFYLEALDRQIRKQHENPSVGIILCRDCDPEIVGYAQSRDMSPTKVAEYKTQLIEKTKIQAKVNELFNRRSQLKGKEISADVQESWDVCT